MSDLWNVYAWNRKHSTHAVRVCEHVSIQEASFTVEAYLNRGLDWDAYMVQIEDDPGDEGYWRIQNPEEQYDRLLSKL